MRKQAPEARQAHLKDCDTLWEAACMRAATPLRCAVALTAELAIKP